MVTQDTFSTAFLGNTGIATKRMGLSTTYRPGKRVVFTALDHGINFFFAFSIDTQAMAALRELSGSQRDKYLITTGASNYIWWRQDVRKALEKRLRQLRTDYIDFFLFLGVMKPKELPEKVIDDLCRIREEGKVRCIGVSTHDRKLAGRLAEDGRLDTFMIRYNAAHRGAEEDIFPHLATHNPAVIGYTATRWSYLIRRQKGWPKDRPIPTAVQCYRFVLSSPSIDVVLTAPKNERELLENLTALEAGPLCNDEMSLLKEYGDLVRTRRKWFM